MAKSKKIKKLSRAAQADAKLAASAEMRQLVDTSLEDMRHYEKMLTKADNPEEKMLRIQQLYFSNLKQAGTPLALSQRVLADLLTRADISRMMGDEADPLSDKYLKILEQINRNIKLTNDMANKSVNVRVEKVNDRDMKIVDAEIIGEMFKDE